MLEFREVSKFFQGPDGQVQALKSVSLSVGASELVVVQGPSGCGKTTLLLTAGGLLKPNSGTVFIDGENPYHLGMNRRSTLRAEKIGFVFQQFFLVPYFSVLENVLAPSAARPQAGVLERARELICHFNMEHRINHLPNQLSTGECQRTALARALLNNPKLILADEPTGNLDEENGKIVLGYLSEFADDGGAVLIVTHDTQIVQFVHRSIKLCQGATV
jgi:putative ABC transport system ATP-binding protein